MTPVRATAISCPAQREVLAFTGCLGYGANEENGFDRWFA